MPTPTKLAYPCRDFDPHNPIDPTDLFSRTGDDSRIACPNCAHALRLFSFGAVCQNAGCLYRIPPAKELRHGVKSTAW